MGCPQMTLMGIEQKRMNGTKTFSDFISFVGFCGKSDGCFTAKGVLRFP